MAQRLGSNSLLAIIGVTYGLVVYAVGIPCLFHFATGLYCPGCGATRAVKCLLHGDWSGAVHQNGWLVIFVLPWLLVLGASKLFPRNSPIQKATDLASKIVAAAAIAFFVLRNVPLPILECLRPFGK